MGKQKFKKGFVQKESPSSNKPPSDGEEDDVWDPQYPKGPRTSEERLFNDPQLRASLSKFLTGPEPLANLSIFGQMAKLYNVDPLDALVRALPQFTCRVSAERVLRFLQQHSYSQLLESERPRVFGLLLKELSPSGKEFQSPVVTAWSFIQITPEKDESMASYVQRFNSQFDNCKFEHMGMALFLHSLHNKDLSERILEHQPTSLDDVFSVSTRLYGLRLKTPWQLSHHGGLSSKRNFHHSESHSTVSNSSSSSSLGPRRKKEKRMKKSKEQLKAKSGGSLVCSRCGHATHTVDKCHAKRHKDGHVLTSVTSPRSGDSNQRMIRRVPPPPPPPRVSTQSRSTYSHHSDTSDSEGESDEKEQTQPFHPDDYLDIGTTFELQDEESNCRAVGICQDILLEVQVNDQPIHALIDCGADQCLMKYQDWMKDHLSDAGDSALILADRSRVKPEGYLAVRIKWHDWVVDRYVAVIKTLSSDFILGTDWLHIVNPLVDFHTMTAIPRDEGLCVLPSNHVLDEFPKLCEELLTLPPSRGSLDFTINLCDHHSPPKYYLIRLSQVEFQEAERTVSTFLERGWIEPIISPNYVFPILFVRKKNGELRMCVDYKGLNKLTIKKRYPMKLMDELIDNASGCDWYSLLDLKKAYHQIRICPEHRHLTAFRVGNRCYQWNVLPFGLSNAPPAFQAIIDNIFQDFDPLKVSAYLDDICIHTNGSLEDHLAEVRRVLQTLQDNGLHISKSKCEVGVREVAWIGYHLSSKGAKPIPDRIPPILQIPIPKRVTDLRSFLGSVQYYSKYFRNLAAGVEPLQRHLKGPKKGSKRKLLEWTEEDTTLFNKVKQQLSKLPTLFPIRKVPSEAELHLYTDASEFAIGAVLQYGDKPLQFYSASLSCHERLWPIRQKELYAAIRALRKWRHWLFGRPVKVFTDHKSLSSMLVTNKKIQENRVMRWTEELAEYDVEFVYIQGEKNVVADSLSRIRFVHTLTDHSPINPTKKDYEKDPFWGKVLNNLQDYPKFTLDGEVLRLQDRLCIPQTFVSKVLKLAHDHPSSGHRGVVMTQRRVARHFYWVGLYDDVKKFVSTCHQCMLAKGGRKLKVALQPLPVAPYPWHTVTMDLITGLPLTKQGFDSIYVFVDKFSKTVHLAPCSKSIDSEGCLDIFMRDIYRLHGLPEVLISDRDPRFTSELYKRTMGKFAISVRMSTSGHAQTDGQTERANRVIGDMIRAFTTSNDSLWVEYLPTIEFAINSSPTAATGISPFEATCGILPRQIGFPQRAPTEPQSLDANLRILGQLQRKALENLEETFQRALPENPAAPVLKGGETVYVDSQLFKDEDSRLRRPKTSSKVRGPFKVKRVLGPAHYEIDFLGFPTRINKVINIKYLRPMSGLPRAISRPQPVSRDVYEVENILGTKRIHGKTYYKVKWKGYPEYEATLEPLEHLVDSASEILSKFQAEQEKVKQVKRKKRQIKS
eukprot:m.93676 g.93676  ORF g.93676 m.93676 type:complete len:1457 (-) comp12394_c0_seq2:310-4680(-)